VHQANSSAAGAPLPIPPDDQAVAGASATEAHPFPEPPTIEQPIIYSNPQTEMPTLPEEKIPSLTPAPESQAQAQAHSPLNRSETAELALGPDGATPPPLTDTANPSLRINLMLTTGARHAYTISQKYLTSRKVEAVDAEGNFDPREMSGYKLKELIWTDWRSEWEPRPRDPAAIRLIIMGRMIDDKSVIKGMEFPGSGKLGEVCH